MELKHGQMKQLKPETTEKPRSSLRRYAAAGVLVAGLAILPSMAAAQTGYTKMKTAVGVMSKSTQAIPERYAEMKKDLQAKLDCNKHPVLALICVTKKSVVKEGDPIVFIEFMTEKSGFFEVKAGKIDDQGVDIKMSMEIFMSEHASNDKKPFVIRYGETKRVPEFAPLIKVKAEKGDTPGTAIIMVKPLKGK